MKIKRITAYPLRYPEPHDHNNLRYITLARIEAEDGLVGWGESISQFPDSAQATKLIIEHGFAPLLVNEDAMDIERLWQKMLARIWWYGPQGIAAFAVSAVDMALWDLKGKITGLPVWGLIGNVVRDRVVPMASIHLDMDDLDWSVAEFKGFRDEGYRIVKGGWGKRPESVFGLDRKKDLELVRRMRETIGEEVDLAIDVLGARVKWDVATAIRRFQDLEPFRLKWIEEPLPSHDLAAHVRLRSMVTTAIGTGEQEWNVEGYRRLIRSGGVDIIQMDPGRCHGITGCRHVIKLIEAENLKFTAHAWSSALNIAASVHLLATSSHGLCMDFKPHESPMQHELVTDPWIQKDGYLELRNAPGLGVTVREEVVRSYEFSL
ncbi:MAG: mandelate racemase/muconate lactonizing enzyme family protein [Acidobacteriota bacterium]|nr:mandelate racemase/muconate lactonizing enzyme family protein [Acidobacteriota bacterium]